MNFRVHIGLFHSDKFSLANTLGLPVLVQLVNVKLPSIRMQAVSGLLFTVLVVFVKRVPQTISIEVPNF